MALVLCVSLILLLFAVGAGLHTRAAKRYVLARVTDYLASQDISLQAGTLDYNLFTLTVSLDDAVVGSRSRPEAPPVARVRHVDARLDLGELLRGRYVVTRGSLADADVDVRIDEDGRTNLPQLPERTTKSEPIEYLVERFALNGARLRFEDRRQQLLLVLPIESVGVEGQRATWRQRIRIAAGGGEVRLQARMLPIDRLVGDIDLGRDTLRLTRFDLTTGESTMSLAGNMVRFEDPRFDVAVRTRLDVTRLAAFAGVGEPVGGVVEADVKAIGPLAELKIQADARGQGLSYRELKDQQVQARASYEAASGVARIEQARVDGPFGRVRASGAFALAVRDTEAARTQSTQVAAPRADANGSMATGARDSHLEVEAEQVDAGRIARALRLPYGAASQVNGRIRARWPALEYARATGDARLVFTPTRGRVPRGQMPLAGAIVATAGADTPEGGAAPAPRTPSAQRITIDLRQLEALGATVEGRVTLAPRMTDIERANAARERSASTGSSRPGASGARGREAAVRTADGVTRAGRGDAQATRETSAAAQPGPFDQAALGGSVRARAGDLSYVIAAVERFLGRPAGSLAPAPIAGALAVDATLSGSIARPDVRAAVDAPDLAIGQVSGVRLSAQARYTSDAVTLTQADATWQSSRVQAAGGVGLAGRRPIDLRLSGEVAELAPVLSAAGHGDLPVSGGASFQATAQGTVSNPRAALELRGRDIAAYGERIGAVSLDAGWANRAIDVSRLQIDKPQGEAGDGTLTASGRYDLARGRYAIDLTSQNLRLSTLTLPDGRPVRGAIDLSAKGEGTMESPGGSGTMRVRELRIGEEALGNVELDIDAQVAERLARLRARADRFNVRGEARVSTVAPYRTSADVKLEDLDLTTLPLHLDTPITGTVRGALTLSADLKDPAAGEARATIDQFAMTWNGQPIALDGPAMIRYAARRAYIDRLTVRAQDSIVSVRGELPVELATEAAAGRSASSLSPATAGGSATGAPGASASGAGASGAAASAAAGAASAMTASTAAPEPAEGAIEIDAKANLATLASYAPKELGLTAQGDLALNGTVRGTLRRIDPALTLTVANASIGTSRLPEPVSAIGARLELANGGLTIADLRAALGQARFSASGQVPLGWLPEDLPVEIPRQTGPATVQAKLEGLDLATLPGAPEPLSGRISASADLHAPRPDAGTLAGRITFPELALAFDNLTLAQQGTSALTFDRGELQVERFSLEGTAGSIDLTGRASLTGPKPLDIVARANLNAGALSTFTERVRFAGRTTVEVAATGTFDAPQLKGFAELANGRLLMDEPQVAATGLQARVELTPTLITLARLEGALNGGTIAGSGRVALAGATPRDIDLRLKATDIALDTPLDLRSLSNADLRITQRAATPPAAGVNATPPAAAGAPPEQRSSPQRATERPAAEAEELPPEIIVGGQVTIVEAGLTDDINLDAGIFQALTAPRSLDLTEQRNPLLERVRFDVAVKTDTPIIIDNNLARAELDADLRLLGTPYETGLSGRLDVTEGSELLLNERRYAVNRGIVTFLGERRITPSLDLQLETTARKYDITIEATGTPDDTTTTFTSTPSLPEPDILALLVTGRTLDEMRGEEFDVAKSQVLSYLGGRVGSQLGRGLQRATGLSTVRVEPNLIASEANPGARLTLGQDLTDDLSLVYSTDLVNSSDNIWIAEYDVSRQFTTRAVRQSDASYRLDFRHDVRFGGVPEPNRQRRPRHTVKSVRVAGAPGIPEQELLERFKLKPGDRYDFFAARDGVQRVMRTYHERDWLQARMRVERVLSGDEVDLTLRAVAGPKVTLTFDGYAPPRSFMKEARTIWSRGVFEGQRADDVRDALRARLIEEKYLDAKITYDVTRPTEETRHAVFTVEPGVKFEKVTLAFEGASGLSSDELADVIKEQKLATKLFTHPREVTGLLRRLYQERSYLAAEVDAPRPAFDAATRSARIVVPIREGRSFHIRTVSFGGNKVIPADTLLAEVPTVKGDPYYPATAERALVRIRQLYWSQGYNDVRPTYTLALDRDEGIVDLHFTIVEGKRTVIAGIDVQGNQETSDALVRRELELAPGRPLDLSALSRSRKNLYDTGAYSLVDITQKRPEGAPVAPVAPVAPASQLDASAPGNGSGEQSASSAPTQPASRPADEPVRVNVTLREVQPFQIRYGALFDTERGVGGIFDLSNHNSLGKARVVGLRSRYDSQVREARLYMSQPSLRSLPIQTIASIYIREERNPATSRAEAFNVDRYGIMLQQEKKLRDHYVWSYGYRFERARTYEPELGGPRPSLINVSPLTSTFTRETRDEVLDATQGSFFSQAFSFSPAWLGSDVPFIKYFGQYFRYFPLQEAKRKRFTNEILRPRLVFATGVRLGLAHGFGAADLDPVTLEQMVLDGGTSRVPKSERFLAGGSTTLRGFAQNSLGPIGRDGVPLGGEAMFVLNNELRFPLYGIFDGVAFVDIGNVFGRVSDFSLTEMRESGGVGLRLRTPWILVRVDYGIPFDRRPGEARSRFFFSIGQAF